MADIAKAIKAYVAMRDEISERKKQFTADTLELKEKMVELEAYLKQELNSLGLESLPTEFGTAFTSTKTSVRVTDRSMLEAHLAKTGEFNLLTLSANKIAVAEYVDEHKMAPPGVQIDSFVAVNVRRATKKK